MQIRKFTPISRRFRPKRFSEVYGQAPIVQTLQNALKHEQLAPAYLFCGSKGTGKTSLARIVAKALNCKNRSEEGEPCDQCARCRSIAQGSDLDVLEIDAASNRGIDDIRNLKETIGYATFKDKNKVFIIDEVHMLTKEAFNALLKTLEEPPPNVYFFLATTEVHKVLPTVVSRCQRFDLQRINNAHIIKKLRCVAQELDVDIKDDALGLLAKESEGSLRDAEALFDQCRCSITGAITEENASEVLGTVCRTTWFTLDQAYRTNDVASAFSLAETLLTTGRDIPYLVEELINHFRTIALLHTKSLDPKQHFVSPKEQTGYADAKVTYTKEKTLYILDMLSKSLFLSLKAPVKRIHLEMLLLHILQTKNRKTLDEILIDLQALKDNPSPTPVQKPPPVTTPSTPKETSTEKKAPHSETLFQFAAVELQGNLTIHKRHLLYLDKE